MSENTYGKSIKNKVIVLLMVLFVYGFLFLGILLPDGDISHVERRPLAQFPSFSAENVWKGKFMADFEKYAMDQFPFREDFRRIEMVTSGYLLGRKDSHQIYEKKGSAIKMEYPMNQDSLDYAASRFQFVYDKYLKESGSKIYLSVIPDKNTLVGKEYGYPALDYREFTDYLRSKMSYAEFISLEGKLTISDYYDTDLHWRQEKLLEVADYLASSMGVELSAEYETKKTEKPFCGIYYGQTAKRLLGDDLYYLDNALLEQCSVFDYETNKTLPIYDLEEAAGEDPYRMFLSGSKSLLVIDNPQATEKKELIVFRDSFGSSLMPLFAEGYSKITLIDIRYMSPMYLGKFVAFEGQDVLFLYSTPVLNNSVTIK